MKVGFIGLGAMGSAMASNLVAAGHAVTVWNRSPAAAEPLASLGAKVVRTADRAVQGEAVLSMLANDAAVREVFLDGGLLDAMDPGTVHVNHATISLALAKELAEAHARRGLGYVAAPVFGRPDVAAAGRLNILAAGVPASVEKVRPLLQAMAAKVWPLGEAPERANVVKLAGNFMLAAAIESMAEASALARAHGVAAADFLEVMTATLFAAPAYQGYAKPIAERRYKPAGFALPLGYKDIGLAQAAAEAARVPMPFAGVLRDGLLEALAAGDEDVDWSVLAEVAARRAHLGD
ncbi:NAD(P)-dependent oxidoreductase [Fulvimonas soli]|jgi:3-hydroxyisobutyrate dehydrogenase-like beta-hydroxyacid dehydrogenase|uniref:3-hydroxyisobutyrate dehydrogenase-like beta-hydroxyacid dehydrogenase n=1 Tax=Fulvimonas soli TaxID=155197 RepID=A0A316IH12_9GAMM|nr:NAD(P)-dependent oxidoreductase [Fulvimonas soli]PWK91956.1 3-hydroxyisobutyrate dehydrogenase-like beta-hydroxyacid dehydrogenase [Fulvimonas soli]TNY25145.1 oxidoreductase [Fulvimonas soli]